MTTIKRVQDIEAWKKARVLVREVYRLCASGPLHKDFGLKDQLCRAAVSTMSNVAEGYARDGDNEFAHFLDIARGSGTEVQSLLYVALDVGYISRSDFDRMYAVADETIALITGFRSYLRKGHTPTSRRNDLRRKAVVPQAITPSSGFSDSGLPDSQTPRLLDPELQARRYEH